MKFLRRPPAVLAGLLTLLTLGGKLAAQPFGLSGRIGNSTLRLPASAPSYGYATTNAFGGLSFADPMAVRTPPGETNRLFVVEQNGVIAVITNLAAPTRTVFLDIASRVAGGVPNDERGLLGLEFHPGYASNRQFYVYYSTTISGQLHQRLARFVTRADDANSADPLSEQPLLTMRDDASNHNGGDVHFGPDGYLYVSLGDEGGGDDSWNNSQLIDKDFWSGILRLDVDLRAENLDPNPHAAIHPGTYRVPADNPFVGVTNWQGRILNPPSVRTEFYAVGLRNPWRFSFDPLTGRLYCGDVGQGSREEVDIIVKGGNYGWAFREGFIAGPKAAPAGVTPINPILDYSHGNATNQGSSITGGVVYRGSRLPALQGSYVFADYVSGNVWATRDTGAVPSPFFRLANDPGIAGFGVDPSNGDVLICDAGDDVIKRLVYRQVGGAEPPATLADGGVFSDLPSLTVAPGFVPYEVNVPLWSDGATKARWFYVPTNRTVAFRATENWSFPTGTVWIKHFEMEMTNGMAASRRRLETRLLVRDSGTGVYGVTYRWGERRDNASLVDENGSDEPLVIYDGTGGILRTQVWHYPGRLECLRCHTGPNQGGLALGFQTAQLNRDFDYGVVVDNQIRALEHAGYFGATPERPIINSLRALAPLSDERVSVEQRVRSYLAANCANCHLPGGTGLGGLDLRLFTPLSQSGLINGAVANDLGDHASRTIVPGSVARSVIWQRMVSTGPIRMPPLGTSVVDADAARLIERWITNDLPSYQTLAEWQTNHFGSSTSAVALASADPDADRGLNLQEYLAGTDPLSATSAWPIHVTRTGDTVEIFYEQVPNRGVEIQWTTNLAAGSWQFLDLPANRPFIPRDAGVTRLAVPAAPGAGDATRYFRARIYEP